MPLCTQICKMFEPMTGLECTFTILLLADLDNMSLGYMYHLLVCHSFVKLQRSISVCGVCMCMCVCVCVFCVHGGLSIHFVCVSCMFMKGYNVLLVNIFI